MYWALTSPNRRSEKYFLRYYLNVACIADKSDEMLERKTILLFLQKHLEKM
jgi:hypothetical protein